MKTACLLLSLFCFGACCRRFAAQCCAVHGRLHMHSLTQREKTSGPPSRTRQHRSLCTESMSWDRLCYRLLLTELPRTIKCEAAKPKQILSRRCSAWASGAVCIFEHLQPEGPVQEAGFDPTPLCIGVPNPGDQNFSSLPIPASTGPAV